eukprot:scaffold203930_cov31-Tisochrysis_lutea.AAC.1
MAEPAAGGDCGTPTNYLVSPFVTLRCMPEAGGSPHEREAILLRPSPSVRAVCPSGRGRVRARLRTAARARPIFQRLDDRAEE